jgi:putative heme transporter
LEGVVPIRVLPRHLFSLASALIAALLVVLVPKSAGTTWTQVGAALLAVPPLVVSALGLVWIAGLTCNSVALAASLPGLSVRRAMLLSLSGSAVANVLPLGGAAGVGFNYAMTRRWGFSAASFSAYTATTNVFDVAAKLVLAATAAAVLVLDGSTAALHLGAPTASLLLLPPLALGLLLHPAWATRIGRRLDDASRLAGHLVRRPVRTQLGRQLPELAARTSSVIRRRWRRLSVGTVGYAALLALLFGGCLHAVGVDLTLPLLVTGLAADRVLTLLPITPGGVGVVEGGTALVLTALGAAPEPVVSGVLLYRAFTYFAEIPLGGLSAVIWTLRGGGRPNVTPNGSPMLSPAKGCR